MPQNPANTKMVLFPVSQKAQQNQVFGSGYLGSHVADTYLASLLHCVMVKRH